MSQLISELYIFDKDDFYDQNDSFDFVAYKDSIFVVKDAEDWDEVEEVLDSLEQDWVDDYKEDLNHHYQMYVGGEFNPNVLMGYVRGSEMWIYSKGGFTLDPTSSLFIKKIAKQLGVKKVSLSSEDLGVDGDGDPMEDIQRGYMDLLGAIPDVGYHGTHSDAVLGILRTGLRPGGQMGKSNWKKQRIVHNEAVSLVFSKHKSAFHAYNSCRDKQEFSFPVILGFRFPDKSKIMPDYDVDSKTSNDHYEDIRDEVGVDLDDYDDDYLDTKRSFNSLKSSVEVGVVGYSGRIPASFVVEIYAFSYAKKSWEKITKERFFEMEEIVSDYGMEFQDYTKEDIDKFQEENED